MTEPAGQQAEIASPFGVDSTTADVIAGVDLRGTFAVVTGGSAGLGRETALTLAKAGAEVFLGARSADALAATAAELEQTGASGAHHHVLDLTDASSVDAFADAVLALGKPVDILVANAGVMAAPLTRTAAGDELQIATNCLGHAVLMSRLARAVVESGRGRVVSLSSVGHHFGDVELDDLNWERRDYDKWVAYGQSKTANILLAVKVATELGEHGVTALAVHPGMIPTDLSQFLEPEDYVHAAELMGEHAANMPPMKTLETGPATSVWAATAAVLEGHGPLYLEDCHVAEVVDTPNYTHGVVRRALDPDTADRLWAAAERLLGRPLPFDVKGARP